LQPFGGDSGTQWWVVCDLEANVWVTRFKIDGPKKEVKIIAMLSSLTIILTGSKIIIFSTNGN